VNDQYNFQFFLAATCIYEAFMAWLESHLRLMGIIVRLSWKDLQQKEQQLMSEEFDRTRRCFVVLSTLGVRSEYDYNNKVTCYFLFVNS
jgi:hypothetical protein